MAHLVAESGPLEGQIFPIDPGLTIGRAPHNTIALPQSRHASRDHCKVWQEGPKRYALADLGSTNGTLLNDDSVTRQSLEDGDRIGIGDAVFRFVLDESEKEQKKAPAPESARPDLASVLRGDAPMKAPTTEASAKEAGTLEVKQRVLQYQKKSKRGSLLSWNMGQMAGPTKWIVVLIVLGATVGLFLIAKNLATGGTQREPVPIPSDE